MFHYFSRSSDGNKITRPNTMFYNKTINFLQRRKLFRQWNFVKSLINVGPIRLINTKIISRQQIMRFSEIMNNFKKGPSICGKEGWLPEIGKPFNNFRFGQTKRREVPHSSIPRRLQKFSRGGLGEVTGSCLRTGRPPLGGRIVKGCTRGSSPGCVGTSTGSPGAPLASAAASAFSPGNIKDW